MTGRRKKSVIYARKRFGYFAEETTLHGFPDIHKSGNTCLKVFWVAVLLISIAAVAYECYQVIGDFIERPVITLYDWKSVNAFEFPQVEICQESMINYTKLDELTLHPQIAGMAKMAVVDSVMEAFERVLGHAFGEVFKYPIFYEVLTRPTKTEAIAQLKQVLQRVKPYASSGPAFDAICANLEAELRDLFPNVTTGNDTDYFALHYYSVSKYLTTDGGLDVEKFFDDAGFDLDQVLVHCEFLGEAIKCSDIAKPVFDQRYGRCFLIDVKRSQTIGGTGLLLVINANSAFGIPELPNFPDGIQVRIHKEINPAELDALRIPSKTMSSIALEPTYFNLEVSQSYGRCLDDVERIAITYPYSDTVCRMDCFVNYTMAFCNCSMVIPKAYIKEGFKHRACMSPEEADCINDFMQESSHTDQCVSKCRSSCEYWDYKPSVSYNNFPSKALLRRLVDAKIFNPVFNYGEVMSVATLLMRCRRGKAFGLGISDFDVKESILGTNGKKSFHDLIILDISFTELSYMDVSQQLSATFDGFISQIGGIFGLFLGASLISFVQVASFFALKCCCPLVKKAVRRPSDPIADISNQGGSGATARVTFQNV